MGRFTWKSTVKHSRWCFGTNVKWKVFFDISRFGCQNGYFSLHGCHDGTRMATKLARIVFTIKSYCFERAIVFSSSNGFYCAQMFDRKCGDIHDCEQSFEKKGAINVYQLYHARNFCHDN